MKLFPNRLATLLAVRNCRRTSLKYELVRNRGETFCIAETNPSPSQRLKVKSSIQHL